ncbi:MAG TPA: OmpA family protein [Geminicoccaceae bacterium]|nr:OmpA family protein [Geminicoccaceae bacterium]
MRRVLVGCGSATVFAAALALGSSASLAQSEELGARWGEGPDRLCNVVMDSDGEPVVQTTGEDPVTQNETFDCPEQVAAVEPAAPPPAPLPESGRIYFEFDEYDLTPEARAALDDMIFDIRDRELGGIVAAGHADTAGPPDYNMELSERRAETIATELARAGIPAQIITTEAYGETQLAVPTPDGTPEQANRRVVVDFQR